MKKILIVHTQGGMGDVLLSSPIAEALHRKHPGCEVTYWIQAQFQELFLHHPFVDRVMVLPQDARFKEIIKFLKLQKFDAVLFPWSKGWQVWASFLAGIPIRIGQASRLLYSFLLTHPVQVRSAIGDTHSHWVDVQLDYARAIECPTEGLKPRVNLLPNELHKATGLIKETFSSFPDRPLCGMHVCKGITAEPTRWPIDRFVEIGRRLVEDSRYNLILTGSQSEWSLVESVKTAIGLAPVVNFAGKYGLRETAAHIALMDVFVCPDTGPGHLAAALNVPVVSIFALRSDFPDRWSPYGSCHRVIRNSVFPCHGTCVKETCSRFDCISLINVDDVLEAVNHISLQRFSLEVP